MELGGGSMNESINCSKCNMQWPIKLFNLAMDIFCPTCGKMLRLSEEQSQKPGTSEAAQTFWGLVGFVAVLAGISAIIRNLE
jgi:uncharacterized Zn finger protein (UPF0148 family)